MEAAFKYMNGFFKGLTGLILTVLGLGVAVEILYGGGALMGISVIENIMGVINGLGTSGIAGLVGLLIIWHLLTAK